MAPGGFLAQVGNELAGRVGGPLTFRFVLMPTVAALLGVRAGLRQARAGGRPLLAALLPGAGGRGPALHSAWKDIGRVVLLALVMDIAYQFFFLGHFRPIEALLVAFACAVLPYAAFHGLTAGAARRFFCPVHRKEAP